MHDDRGRALDDIDLAASIAAALHGRLRASGITVDVSHGRVTLEGEGRSCEQRDAAESIARQFSANVVNAVQIERPPSRDRRRPRLGGNP